MVVIDADTHVDETEETWSYLAANEKKFKPLTVIPDEKSSEGASIKGYNRYWIIDGHLRVRRIRDDKRTGTIECVRELRDVPARLKQMDSLGVDIQVLYPSLFLSQVSGRPGVELALCKAYNRWMADKWLEGDGRLRWVAPLPLMTMSAAVEELDFAVKHGAVGILKKGRESGNRLPSDPYFFPLYEAADALNIPVCIHLGTGDPAFSDADPHAFDSMLVFTVPVLEAFHALVTNNVAAAFQTLRFGFIETSGSWLPYMIRELRRCADRMSWMKSFDFDNELLKKHRLYIACDTYDDVATLVALGGKDNLIIGSDFGHADMASEIDAIGKLKGMSESGELSDVAVNKILSSNPHKFYGINL